MMIDIAFQVLKVIVVRKAKRFKRIPKARSALEESIAKVHTITVYSNSEMTKPG